MAKRYSGYQRLKFERPADGVLRIRLNNPNNPLNSADDVMHRELAEVWREVDTDKEIGAVILAGGEKAFSAGGDFGLIRRIIEDHDYKMQVWKEARDIVYNVVNCSKPIVAALNGPSVGAGLATALCCDITIAAKSAKIIDGHTRLGVAAGDHAVIIWPLLVGMAKAKYYLLTCDSMTGEEAERIGLVSLCVEDDQLEARSLEVAGRLAAGAQTAISFTKYALNNWLRMMGPHFDTSLALEFLGWDGPEATEGLQSHLEKRPPAFPKKNPLS